jgi:peroxidase
MGYPPEFYHRNSGRKLPNARSVSTAVHAGTDKSFRHVTTMVMQFGQFLDHDLTLTPEMNLCKMKCPASEMEVDCCKFVGETEASDYAFQLEPSIILDDGTIF